MADESLVYREGLPPNAVVVVVVPGASPLEEALIQDREDRARLEVLRHPKRYKITEVEPEKGLLVSRLRRRAEKIREMLRNWREG